MKKTCRHSIIRLAATVVVFLLLVGAVSTPQAVKADIDLRDDKIRLGFLGSEQEEWERLPKWITRNLVVGDPIPVCSGDYPIATRMAVGRWNTALGIAAFEVLKPPDTVIEGPEDEDCDVELTNNGQEWMPANGVARLTVSKGRWLSGKFEFAGTVLQYACLANVDGCARFEEMGWHTSENRESSAAPLHPKNLDWRSFHGRAEIIINPHPSLVDYRPGGDTYIVHLIAHELGHILALRDYYCHVAGSFPNVKNHPDRLDPSNSLHPDEKSLMNSFIGRIVKVQTPQGVLLDEISCDPVDPVPTKRDLDDYRAIYTPATVSIRSAKVIGQTVILDWDQSNVFVESDFEIQRKNGAIWEMEEIADANAESITLTNQPSGEQRYQIVARTKALPPQTAEQEYFHGKPAKIVVSVQPPAPTGLTVSDVTNNGATLSWSGTDNAGGFEAQLDGTDLETTLGETATSYPFTGLTAGTAHVLGVAETRDGLTSTFATLTLLKPPKRIAEGTKTHNSVAYTWANDNPAGSVTSAEVKIGASGTVETADSLTSHTFGSLVADKSHTFYIRLKNAQGPSAWRTVTATTSSPPTNPQPRPRPKKPDPVVTTEEVGRTTVAYEWRGFGDLPGGRPPDPPGTCYFELYQRDRYALAEFETSWKFDRSIWKWVLDPLTKVQIGLETGYLYTEWYTEGRRSYFSCPTGTDSVAGASAPPAGVLLPGDYTMAWGGEWYSFTIPSGAEVSLTSRTVGAQETMVFGVAGGAEVVVIPAQLATDPPTSDNVALAAIVASFRAETDPAKLPAGAERRTCADSPPRDDAGALNLDLDAQWCAVVSSGGAVTVRYGEERLSLTIPAERTWLIFAAPQSESTEPTGIWVMDRQSKAYVILNPATAAELARHAPAAAEGLPALLDAIAASASVPATE